MALARYQCIRDGEYGHKYRVWDTHTSKFVEPFEARSNKRQAQVRADILNRPPLLIKAFKTSFGCRVTLLSPVPVECPPVDCKQFAAGVGIMLDILVAAGFDPWVAVTLDLREVIEE